MTAGAGAGGEGAGREATGRVAAGRTGAGAVRRAGLGVVFFGAVTVTSGNVSDTWPKAGPGEVSNGNQHHMRPGVTGAALWLPYFAYEMR